MTVRKLWRKCLWLCASHLFINQPAIRLSSGRVSRTLLRVSRVTADYLYKFLLSSLLVSIIRHLSFSPRFSLCFAFCSSALVASLPAFSPCPHSPLFFSLSSHSLSLIVARGSWLPCWCHCLKLWGPRGHRSWKSPFPLTVRPVGHTHKKHQLRDSSGR